MSVTQPYDVFQRAGATGAGLHHTHHRVLVAPAHGRFIAKVDEGASVDAGELIACVASSSRSIDLYAPCRAVVASLLVCDGDRVQPGKPLVHLEAL